jgi:hypothetical protein
MTHKADVLIVAVIKVESSATLQAFELVSSFGGTNSDV